MSTRNSPVKAKMEKMRRAGQSARFAVKADGVKTVTRKVITYRGTLERKVEQVRVVERKPREHKVATLSKGILGSFDAWSNEGPRLIRNGVVIG